jgi:hypothetical protein
MKSVLRLALLIGTATSLRAQGWTVGLKGGLGQGGFTKRSEFAWSATGMNLALSFSRPVTERVSIQPELATSQTIGQSTIGGSVLTYSSDDIDVPLLVRADLSRRAGLTPFVLAGPSLTIHASCGMQFMVAGSVSNIDCDKESFLSRLDFAVIAGAGVSKTFGPTTLSAELRANVKLRSQGMPDGSGYARPLGWAMLFGASVPLSSTFRGRSPNALRPGGIQLDVLSQSQGLFGAASFDGSRESGSSRHISLRTRAADASKVLAMLATQAGVTLRLPPNIRRKVTVSLTDIAAGDALHVVILEAGLSILEQPDASVLHVAAERHTGGSDN